MCTEIPTATCAGVPVGITRERRASKSSPATILMGIFESSQNLRPPTGCGAAKDRALQRCFEVKHGVCGEVAELQLNPRISMTCQEYRRIQTGAGANRGWSC